MNKLVRHQTEAAGFWLQPTSSELIFIANQCLSWRFMDCAALQGVSAVSLLEIVFLSLVYVLLKTAVYFGFSDLLFLRKHLWKIRICKTRNREVTPKTQKLMESLSALLLCSHILICTTVLLLRSLLFYFYFFLNKVCWNVVGTRETHLRLISGLHCQAVQSLTDLTVYARPLLQCLISA